MVKASGRALPRRRTPRRLALAAVCLMAPFITGGIGDAWGQDVQNLVNRLERLERSLTLLQRSLYRGEEPPAEALAPVTDPNIPAVSAARLHVRVGELEDQLRQLTGQIEEVGFGVRQVSDRLDKLVADMDFRLRSLEQGTPATQQDLAPGEIAGASPIGEGGLAAPQFPSVRILGQVEQRLVDQVRAGGVQQAEEQVAVAPLPQAPAPVPQTAPAPAPVQQQGLAALQPGAPAAAPLPNATPEAQYEFAYGLLIRRDIANAETALSEFVVAHPDHPLAGNAQYWLGETFYVRDDFMSAARTFAEGYTRYPKSNKAPDNLLKLAMSLNALGRQDDACITFSKLIDEYPNATASIRRRAERERGRLTCP